MNPMTDPTNAVSSEARSTPLNSFLQIPTTFILISRHGAQNTQSRTFSTDACMCIVQNKTEMDDRFHIGFSIPTKPELAYSNHYKTNKKFAHLISNSQQNCPFKIGFQVLKSPGGSGGSKSKQRGKCDTFEKASQASRQP